MKQEVVNKLKAELIEDFAKSLDNNNAIGAITDILEGNAKDNVHGEDGQTQETSLTLKPSIRIEYSSSGDFAIKASINVKNIKSITGEAESSFNIDQPDLFEGGDEDSEGKGGSSENGEGKPGGKRGGRKPKNEQTAA